jgi:hypothetical protein
MTTSPGGRRNNLASSPFQREPEPDVEEFAVGDLVSHDSHGLGRVVGVEPAAVAVDFGSRTVRVPSPFRKMGKL